MRTTQKWIDDLLLDTSTQLYELLCKLMHQNDELKQIVIAAKVWWLRGDVFTLPTG